MDQGLARARQVKAQEETAATVARIEEKVDALAAALEEIKRLLSAGQATPTAEKPAKKTVGA